MLINSKNTYDFIDTTIALQTVNQKTDMLTQMVANETEKLQALQAKEQQQYQNASALVYKLDTLNATLQEQQLAYKQEAVSLTGAAAQLAQQSNTLSAEIQQEREAQAAAAAAAAAADGYYYGGNIQTIPLGPEYSQYDFYPWGQCTWYVAYEVNVPWAGNAYQWYYNAQDLGYSTGQTPEVGSIVVWGAALPYNPYYGHVAYVVKVISSTEFVVHEANYYGLGVVDQRTIYSLVDVEGFIYMS